MWSNTCWDRSENRYLVGAISPEETQYRKGSLVGSGLDKYFRIKGYSDNKFNLDPTPSSANTIAFEYQTATTILPKKWTASTVFAANSYCSYNGNIYQTTSLGTTGSTAPTHTSSSASDGAVTWIYISDPYQYFLADTDSPILDPLLFKDWLKWLFKKEKGLDFEQDEYLAREKARKIYLKTKATRDHYLVNDYESSNLISWRNLPEVI